MSTEERARILADPPDILLAKYVMLELVTHMPLVAANPDSPAWTGRINWALPRQLTAPIQAPTSNEELLGNAAERRQPGEASLCRSSIMPR